MLRILSFLLIVILTASYRSFSPSTKRIFNQAIRSTVTEQNIEENVLQITQNAMKQLQTLNADGKVLRIGVKSGGCSGMSYTMDFVDSSASTGSDHIEYYGQLKCVIDPKSLLFIYGLELDYSSDLMGGGFKFSNPNAKTSCGCGKSFGV